MTATTTTVNDPFEVEMPAGGVMHLQSAEEVDLWTKSHERYVEDYQLVKTNDLVLLGGILQNQVLMFRAQRKLNAMEPETDSAGVPTGRYVMIELDADGAAKHTKQLNTAADQIRTIEQALGIDKKSREAGGQMTVSGYLKTLKDAAHQRGIHITQRTLAYERFVADFRTRLRMLRNLDAEDRAYHDITPEKLLEWCHVQLAHLEEIDKKFDREKGKLFVGKL